jgi:AraC-like DNA-binding protein
MREDGIESLSPVGLRVWLSQGASRMQQAHRHHDLEFNYLLRGTTQYLVGGALVDLPLRRLCVLWGAMPHQVVVSTPARRKFLATIPLSQVMLRNLPPEFLRELLGRGVVIEPQERGGDELLLRQWQRDLNTKRKARRALVESEIAARLQRLALDWVEDESRADAASQAESTPSAAGGDALRYAQQMAALISEKFGEELSVSDIARHVGLHPGYAMTLFRAQTGSTLNAYLTRQRIAHAQRLLATTSLPILEIAGESGFNSLSRFYEAFKAEAHCTPRSFRARLAPE